MELLKGYYAYLAVSGGLLLGLAAQNNWALQMLAFALVSAGALSVQNVSRWYMRASIAADVTMAFKLILGPAVIPPGLLRIVLQYAALVPLLLTGCMLLMGVKDQMHKIDRSPLPEWVLLVVWSTGCILTLLIAPGWLNAAGGKGGKHAPADRLCCTYCRNVPRTACVFTNGGTINESFGYRRRRP